MKIELLKGDITAMACDAIVNAANSSLMGGGGVDGAIHRKGGAAILEDCRAIVAKQGKCKTGEAVITTAGNLPAKHVIHTVGPVWNSGKLKESKLLKNCYVNSINLAAELGLSSIAFPNISTGIYGYPKIDAAAIAIGAILECIKIESTIREIFLVCFDDENFNIYQQQFPLLKTLYRPVNSSELQLIADSGFTAFPQRLPEQPFFYPVENEAYAVQITRQWNVPAYGESFVVEFQVPSSFLQRYPLQNVGGEIHNEYWIPAEELNLFNEQILGKIKLSGTYNS
jgi:O-acetyl-ADP-ribose deacetylase